MTVVTVVCHSGVVLELVALDIPAGDEFVAALQRAWDSGDAVLPIDQRLPPGAKASLMQRFHATVVVGPDNASNKLSGQPVESGDALVVATSGTTGEPKGVVLTHAAVEASARITSLALKADRSTDRWLACLPVAHIGGMAVITRALHTGTPLVVHERFEAAACEQAARDGATLVSLVVAALQGVDISAFRAVLLGGSAIPTHRPGNTVATYGMTETGSGVVYEGYALDEVQLRIVDHQVEIAGPTLLRCYRDGTTPLTGDGWLRTGDAGLLGSNGLLSIKGRVGDVIVTGGEKVWPAQVEHELHQLGWVSEAAVVGRPDKRWGHAVAALVVPTLGALPPSLAELRDTLSDALPRYALPRSLEIVKALPKTSGGKLKRSAL